MSQNSVIEDKLHNEVKVQKYLDLQGLKVFLQYMTARISAMNGTTIPYNGDENSKSISAKIDELWNMVAGGGGTDIQGSLSENVAAILGEYVKRIVENDGVVPEDGYVGVKVDHGYYDDGGNWVDGNLQGKGIYTITINETKLVQKLADLTNNRVTKLVVDKKGNIVVEVDYETGDIHLTIDSTAIDNAIDAIKNYTVNGKTISTNPVLSADDVNLGVDINSEYTAGKSIHESIKNIINTIAGLGYVVELKGVLPEKPSSTTGYENGDVIIVGNSEYVCWESKWYLFGNTSELLSHYNTHTHPCTPAGTVSASFSGQSNNATCSDANQEGYYASVSRLKNDGSLPSYSSIDVSNKDHTHSVTYTPTGSITASFEGKGGSFTTDALTEGGTVKVQSLKNVGALPSYSEISVPNTLHTHTVTHTPAGTVTSTFVGQGETLTSSEADETNRISINSLKSVGVLPSYSSINVSNKDHTHSVTYTPEGTVTSTFTGKAKSVTIDSTEDSVNVYSAKTFGSTPTSSPISVPNTLHTHTVVHIPEGTVASTFTGTSATLTTNGPSGSTTVAVAPTITYINAVLYITFGTTTVASSAHTHQATHTPAGTVASTFTGTSATLTSSKPDTTNVTDINSITDVGSMPTFESVAVATGAHSHTGSYTPEGTIESTFTGTESTITVPKSTSTTSVNSITDVGSLPASEAVSVPSSSHTHTVTHTPAGTVTSTFVGTLATLTSTKPDTTNVTTVNSMTGVGSLPVQEELTVAGAGHVHNVAVTPSGDIDVTFTGNESTITVPKSASVTSVNSMTGVGSLPVFESINVSIPTHKHNVTYTPSGTIDATFTGTTSNTGSPNDALVPPIEIN